MYWRSGKPERFVRPVLWLLCLLGDDVVPVEFAGKVAGRATYGHRVLSTGEPFEIVAPSSYEAQLEGEYVIADVAARRHKIRKALDHVCRTVAGARWREDEALVDKMTHLTEWPDVLLGAFEPGYLALPEEVLVTVMRDHQNYFAVEGADGTLAAYFLAVLNIGLTEANAPIIRQGNERVLRARFNDARFFWEFDQRVPLVERVKLLENVTFQKDLGSYAAKSGRVFELCRILAGLVEARGVALNQNALLDAARLAKVDLTTELVKEFTELQGVIGGLYAASGGLSAIAADAIYDQYLPASAKDAIPRSPEGAILGLADRIDTIAGMFALGMEPTGSKDPFALRRSANAVVRILAESSLPLKLSDVLTPAQARPSVADFFTERIEFYLREGRGQAYDVVKAVMAAGTDDIRDLVARAEAVTAVRGSEDFLAVSAAFKRMKNILAQANERGEEYRKGIGVATVPLALEVLVQASQEVKLDIQMLQEDRRYIEALQRIATLRPLVDTVFEKVMILDSDPKTRQFNLASLEEIVAYTRGVADLSEIVIAR
jgi:glycyl-tRNA synthetase beta chain